MNSEVSNQQFKEIKEALELFLSRQLEIRERLAQVESKQDTLINLLSESKPE